jgi:hypothetical protein
MYINIFNNALSKNLTVKLKIPRLFSRSFIIDYLIEASYNFVGDNIPLNRSGSLSMKIEC